MASSGAQAAPLRWLCGLLLLASAASALKFELAAHAGAESQKKERCIRNFVPRDTLVVVTVKSDGFKGDGMMVNVHVRWSPPSPGPFPPRHECRREGRRADGPDARRRGRSATRWATSTRGRGTWWASRAPSSRRTTTLTLTCASRTRSRAVRCPVSPPPSFLGSHGRRRRLTCPPSHTASAHHGGPAQRHIELDIDIGADAKDWSAIQATEKLKPVEAELRRIEELTAEIVQEMEYLRVREQKLRDTNESTNTRVKWFGVGTTWLLIGLWAWHIMYLRAYFRSKHLI